MVYISLQHQKAVSFSRESTENCCPHIYSQVIAHEYLCILLSNVCLLSLNGEKGRQIHKSFPFHPHPLAAFTYTSGALSPLMFLSMQKLRIQDAGQHPTALTSLAPIIKVLTPPIYPPFFFCPLLFKGPGEKRQSSWRNHLHWPWLGRTRRQTARRRPSARTVLPGRQSEGRTLRLGPSTLFPPPSGAAQKSRLR